MNKSQLIKSLEHEITLLEELKADYYAEGNGTDTYVMTQVGRIDGLRLAISIINIIEKGA